VVIVVVSPVVVISSASVVSDGVVVIGGADVVSIGIFDISVASGGGGVAVIVVIFGFFRARTTSFNTRERVIAKTVKTIKHMKMILTQR
jgi:hypothetical protein